MDGRTKVPVDTTVFTKRGLFDKSLIQIVDTAVIYEEFSQRYGVLQRLDDHIETSFYDIIRFYGNGCINFFIIDRDMQFSPQKLNPRYSGLQGLYYFEKGRIRIQLCGRTDQRGGQGLIYSTVKISGDTLYEKRDNSPFENIYVKRRFPEKFLSYTPYW